MKASVLHVLRGALMGINNIEKTYGNDLHRTDEVRPEYTSDGTCTNKSAATSALA